MVKKSLLNNKRNMMKNMKKQYIKPDLEVFEIKASTLLAGSDPDSISGSPRGDKYIEDGFVE